MGNITHAKVSTIPDGTDTDLVRPSDWNAEHEVARPVNDHDVADKQYVDEATEVLDYGLSFRGEITTLTDTTHFKVASLIGLGTGFFKPFAGSPYEIYVVQADGAAPEGEQTPVVAYTSSDGTFQHVALSVSLAVGDIVLIIHPLVASLGTKATAAATGAVTTTDYLTAYIKQLVTELQVADALIDAIKAKTDNLPSDPADQSLIMAAIAVVDGIVDDIKTITDAIPDAGALTALLASIASILEDTGTTLPATLVTIASYIDTEVQTIIDDLANATDGLGALKDLIDAVQATTNTIEGYTDLIDDATNGLAAIKAEVEGLAGAAMRGTNSAALASVLGALTDVAASGVPTDVDTAMQYLKQLVNDGRDVLFHTRGMAQYAVVTTATSVTEFASTGLIASHHTNDFFNGWWIYVLCADQAAPLHEWKQISDFVAATGTVTHGAFTAQLAVGDIILVVNPMWYQPFIVASALSTHDTDIKALLATITAVGPTKSEMDAGHTILKGLIIAMGG